MLLTYDKKEREIKKFQQLNGLELLLETTEIDQTLSISQFGKGTNKT